MLNFVNDDVALIKSTLESPGFECKELGSYHSYPQNTKNAELKINSSSEIHQSTEFTRQTVAPPCPKL